MVFFRIKKIKGKEYAYLVENDWHRKGSRQTVKDYLGRVYRFELKNNVDFLEYLKIGSVKSYIDNNALKKIIDDLIKLELFKFGVDNEEFRVDLDYHTIQKNGKNVTLMINDGFMCGLTLKNLLNFELENDEEQDGHRLARAFVESGIKVPQEVFIELFGKLYKDTQLKD